jgi:FlaA1/EpsC-like NDP-sugar epimerase
LGLGLGKKIHEEMITSSDSYNTYDVGQFYIILPTNPKWSLEDFILEFNARRVEEGFSYNSGTNNDWESITNLKTYINKYLEKHEK